MHLLFRLKRYTVNKAKCKMPKSWMYYPKSTYCYNLLPIRIADRWWNLDGSAFTKFLVGNKHLGICNADFNNPQLDVPSEIFKFLSAKNGIDPYYFVYNNDYKYDSVVVPVKNRTGVIIQKWYYTLLIVVRPYKEHEICANAYIYYDEEKYNLYKSDNNLNDILELFDRFNINVILNCTKETVNKCSLYNIYMISDKKAKLIEHYKK